VACAAVNKERWDGGRREQCLTSLPSKQRGKPPARAVCAAALPNRNCTLPGFGSLTVVVGYLNFHHGGRDGYETPSPAKI